MHLFNRSPSTIHTHHTVIYDIYSGLFRLGVRYNPSHHCFVMPKVQPQLYNHSARPTTTRTYSTTTAPSGRSYVASTIRQRHVTPLSSSHPQTDDDYVPMPMDIDEDMGGTSNDLSIENEEEQIIVGVKVVAKQKAKRYENSVSTILYSCIAQQLIFSPKDNPLQTWLSHRDEYLDECIRLEGRGSFASRCAGCSSSFPAYRCNDCTHGALWCQKCLVVRHAHSPLHTVQVSNFK